MALEGKTPSEVAGIIIEAVTSGSL